MRAHVGKAGCLVPWDRIESAIFRILTTCLSADELHKLAEFENHKDYAKLLEQFYSERVNDEISELVLFVAVSMRVHNDARSRSLLTSSQIAVGFINNVGVAKSEDLTLKDALDKIIHAQSMLFTPGRFDNPGGACRWGDTVVRFDAIRDFLALTGTHRGKSWSGRLDLLPFCAEIVRIAKSQPRHRQSALLSQTPKPVLRATHASPAAKGAAFRPPPRTSAGGV